ncbi:MAG: hypothetical protein IJR06_07555, partial [Paludibacteraceae bacterium]|nr:hypothetical protein [Paludibacteraceae bacterium]
DTSGGFLWRLPKDVPVSLVYGRQGGELAVATARGEKVATARGSFAAVRADSVARWQAFWAKSAIHP